MRNSRSLERVALLGALLAVFGEIHPLCDQWVQNSQDAQLKGLHGRHLVHTDGVAVDDEADSWERGKGRPTLTASALGRRAVARHVASYTAVQLATTVVATRALGYRVPSRALLAGAAVNAATHAVIDRREPLLWLADKTGKRGYVDHCHAVRIGSKGRPVAESGGPGSAQMELDQALHRAIGVGAAVVTAWLAVRHSR